MPKIYKIGRTTRNPYLRAQEMSQATGVPLPYVLISAIFVKNCAEVERNLHIEFSQNRVNDSREFFYFTDNEVAQAIFRVTVFRQPEQLDELGIGTQASDEATLSHTVQCLEKTIQENRELRHLVEQNERKIAALRDQFKQIEQQHYVQMAERQAISMRTVEDYKRNSDTLATRIREILHHCIENPDAKAYSVRRFIEELRRPVL